MKVDIKIDTSDFDKEMQSITLTKRQMLNIANNGAKVQANGQKMRVPVDTAATKTSIIDQPIEVTETKAVIDTGPSTEYAPVIEYGRRDMPNYPMQPFVRPTAREDLPQTINAIERTFVQVIK